MARVPDRPPAVIAAALLSGAVALAAGAAPGAAREVCRYIGTSDYDGRVAITSDVAAADGLTRVDVSVTFEATTMLFFRVRYLVEEISTWRDGQLIGVAVNNRYLFSGHIVRQQWDDFRPGPDGLLAYRVQAKTLADFSRRHPGFAQYWDPAAFGRPWLADYPSASPERRPDLDLSGPPPAGLRSPLAFAFYWVRWLPEGGTQVPVFLPGFKADKRVDLPVTGPNGSGGRLWQAPLRHPALRAQPPSTATAWVSGDRHLLRLALDLHGAAGSARGLVRLAGCDGAPVPPQDRR